MNKISINIDSEKSHLYTLCDYILINNILYLFYKYDKIYVYVIKDYILTDIYSFYGKDIIIKDNILYISNIVVDEFDDNIDKVVIYINKYNFDINNFPSGLKLIESIKVNTYNEKITRNIKYIEQKIIYCDDIYLILYCEDYDYYRNETTIYGCLICDISKNKNYYIPLKNHKRVFAHTNENIYIVDKKIHIFNTKIKTVGHKSLDYNIYQIKNNLFYTNEYDKKDIIINIDTLEEIKCDNIQSLYFKNIKNNIFLKNNNVFIITKPTLSIFSDNNKLIKLGESYIPLDILIERSKLIQLMLEDLNDITSLNEIINKDIFKNIEIYIDYIKTNIINNESENDSLQDIISSKIILFNIMNYLEDIDVEHIANYIAIKTVNIIKDKNIIDKKIIYENLETLYNSPFTAQFIYVLKTILIYESYKNIITCLENKSCYNYVLKYNLISSNIQHEFLLL